MSTFAEIQSKIQPDLPSQEVNLGDNRASLTVAQAKLLVSQGVVFASNDVISIKDLTDTIEGLSASRIAALKSLGVSQILATDGNLSLGLDQINALATNGITTGVQHETMSAATGQDVPVGRPLGSGIGQSIVALGDGSYAVIYRGAPVAGAGSSIYTQHYDASGNPLGAVTQVSGAALTSESQSTAAALADGGYVVVWSHNGGSSSSAVYAQRFDAEGDAVGGPAQLTTDGPRKYMPGVTGLSDGGYLVTIYQNAGSDAGLTFQRYDANGQPVGSRQALSPAVDLTISISDEGAKITDTVEMADGRVMIIWGVGGSDERALAAQIIDASGSKVGDAFFVNAPTDAAHETPSVASLSDGRFAVTWISYTLENAIVVQLFDDQGNKVGSEVTINSSLYAQDPPKITALENGRYVVTWAWGGQDDPNSAPGQHIGIYAQILDSDGTKIGPVSVVNTTVVGDQFDPQVVGLAGGGYVVVWTDYLNTSSASFEINAQVFSADGIKIGNELDINVNEANAQRLQKITALAGGGFAVTWLDASDGKYYTRTFQNDTEQATVSDTASAISALTVPGVANLRELDIDAVTISDGGSVTLSKAVATALIDISGFRITGAGGIVVGGTGTVLDDFSATDIAHLKTLGVNGLDVSDNKITLALDQATAYLDAGITLASGDAATVKMTFLQMVALDSKLAALANFGMNTVDLAENEIALGLVGYRYLDSIGVRFAASDVLTLTDYKFNIVNLTVAQIAELAEWGVTKIDTNVAETEPAVFSLAQVKAFAAGGISFAADELVHLSDSATALSSLSASDVADLATVGVSKVVADQALALTVSQFAAFAQHGVGIESVNGKVTVHDSGANFAALAIDGIADLSVLGITTLDVTDDKAVLSLAAIKALSAVNAHFADGDRIVMGVSAASLAEMSGDDLAQAKAFGIAAITTAESSLDLSVATARTVKNAGLSLDSDFTARITDTAANLLTVSFQDVANYREMGVDVLRLVDSGSAISGLSLANIANLAGRNVGEVDVTNGAVTLSLAQANQFAASEIVFNAADIVVVTASSATWSDPDTLDLIGLAAIHIDLIDASDNKLTLTLAAAQTYLGAGIGFTGADAVTVKIGYAEAKTLTKTMGSALHDAGVDRIDIDMTASELKALTYTELNAFVAAGVDGITGLTRVAFSNLTYDLTTHTANYNPVISSDGGGATAAVTIAENTKAVTTLKATDKEAATLTYSIVGGADKALFTINAQTGALVFKATPDYETPKDGGKNNAYDVIVQVSDGKLIDTQALTVSVKDVNEVPSAPTLSGTVVKENVATGTLVGTFASKDPEGKVLSYKLLDTAGGLFKLSGSKLMTAKAIDYEKAQKDTVTIEVFDGVNKVTKVFTITISDILETITGTAKGEVLKGGIGMDRIVGFAGNDALYGYGGNDLLEGGDGNDVLFGGAGADRLLGGNGIDTASYAGAATGVSASLANPSANTGDAKGDTYSSVENLSGSSYADRLIGDGKTNVLNGAAGDDVLEGGDGDDVLIGGIGADRLIGGTGSDTASYAGAKAWVVANLLKSSVNTGDAKGDTYSSIENLAGSSYADRLIGDAKANIIDGDAGDDVLSGGAGNDWLIGGAGFDDLYGGAGSDRFLFRSAKELGTSKTATDTIFDFSQKEKDLIDVTAIDASLKKAGDQAFTFIGTGEFSNTAGELRYEKAKADTYVYGDINGDGKADFVLHIDAALTLRAGDFLL
ncbi:hypothetical protein [Sinorhizobium sp. RAC02]|uniref:hypothetical protein n=1 Tax=Sinorhizobium sp. RAC02 TaxID=1842534 RepID=UPI00083DC829|nr:hypothetical protein [Sinorhizobium sp. RAC02]AOF92477.1 cadherin domain protein [Sinorhizobium sp. RAC02]